MSQLSPNKARTPQKSFPTRFEHHSATLAHLACEVRVKNASGGSPNSFGEGVGELPGLSWARLGHSCALLGRSWATFGRFWGALGSLLVASGCAWAPPGSILEGLGPPQAWVLHGSGCNLRHSFRILCAHCCEEPWNVFTCAFCSALAAQQCTNACMKIALALTWLFVSPCSAAVRAQHMESMSKTYCCLTSIFRDFGLDLAAT